MIFTLLSIHNHDRMSSKPRVLHTINWDYFTTYLPGRFRRSPQVVKEAILTDINDLVEEFWRTSSDFEPSFFAMRRLLEILQGCLVCFDIISLFATNKNLLKSDLDDRIRPKFKKLLDGYRKMFDHSLLKSNDLGDMLRFLPGVVVVKSDMSMQGMADLYRIKADLLECLISSTIEPLRPPHVSPTSCYRLDGYLSGFLQDPGRSQLYYCDPILQHISICRHFLSLLDRSNAFDLPP